MQTGVSNLEIGGAGVKVESAFVLPAIEAGGLGIAIGGGHRAVPVAHGDVSLGGKRMARQAVLVVIEVHLGIRPIEDRIGLECLFLALDEGSVAAGAGLGPAQSAEPDIGPGFAQRAVHRLDLGEHGVAVLVLLAAFPKVSPERLHAGGGESGLIDTEVELGQESGEFLDVLIGLGEEESGIDEHDGDLRRVFMDEVEHHRGLDAEAGGGHEVIAQLVVEEADPFARAERGDIGREDLGIEIGFRVEFECLHGVGVRP